jgi:hypothetical protein
MIGIEEVFPAITSSSTEQSGNLGVERVDLPAV